MGLGRSILAGIGEGLDGLGQGLSWQREQDLKTRQVEDDERAQAARQQIEEIMARVAQQNADTNRDANKVDPVEGVDTLDDEGNPTRVFKHASELAGQSFRTAPKPGPAPRDLQHVESVDAKGNPIWALIDPTTGITVSSLPRQASRQADPYGDEAARLQAQSDFARKDDPSNPQGVKSYIEGLGQKYSDINLPPGDPNAATKDPMAGKTITARQQALWEFQNALPTLTRQHALADPTKMKKTFDDTYGSARDAATATVSGDHTVVDDATAIAYLNQKFGRGGGQPAAAPASPGDVVSQLNTPRVAAPAPTAGGDDVIAQMSARPPAPSTRQVGDVVTLRDGSRAKITAIGADGKLQVVPVK